MLLVCTAACVEAQQMEVKDFTRLKRPIWKRSKVAVDKQKAIIDLTTTEKGFTFLANGKEAAEAAEGEGVITVKVPHKTRFLTIKHEQFGQMTWRVPKKYLKRKKHYRATLLANDPTKAYKPQQQWVVIDIDPRDAIVRMDSTTTLVTNGQYTEYLSLGTKTYQIEFLQFSASNFSHEVLHPVFGIEIHVHMQTVGSEILFFSDDVAIVRNKLNALFHAKLAKLKVCLIDHRVADHGIHYALGYREKSADDNSQIGSVCLKPVDQLSVSLNIYVHIFRERNQRVDSGMDLI